MNKKYEPYTLFNGEVLYWYLNDNKGNLHAEDGPAVIYSSGTKYWFKHGKYHREDGPAVIYPDGSELYFFNGCICTSREHFIIKQKYKLIKIDNILYLKDGRILK